jgi:hypothetical protein
MNTRSTWYYINILHVGNIRTVPTSIQVYRTEDFGKARFPQL